MTKEVTLFIKNGGFMMYPLLICSVALLVVVIERAIAFRRANVDGDLLLDRVKEACGTDPAAQAPLAIAICEKTGGPLARIFARGLKNASRQPDAIEMAMEQEAANEQPALEANLPVIRTIVNIAPLLGLLGTIAGMIASFRSASQSGLSNPTQILGGISEALISTATGISLAVLGFISYNYFANLSRKSIEDIEYYGAELVNFLTGRID
jgi:biopolymer transport protein ExbB